MADSSAVISMRLPSSSVARLKKFARWHNWSLSETSARLVEESLRSSEFAMIEFRDSPVGRQAYVKGTGLAVWEVAMVARDYKGDAARAAKHLHWPVERAQAALNYANAFPDEIQDALEENDSYDFETLSRSIPGLKRFTAK